jgi:hypothetical protein
MFVAGLQDKLGPDLGKERHSLKETTMQTATRKLRAILMLRKMTMEIEMRKAKVTLNCLMRGKGRRLEKATQSSN